MNQVVRIDQWGNYAYSEWALKPSEIFVFDDSGLINKYVKYQSMGSSCSEIQSSKLFFNEYDNYNRLISTHGPYKTPMYSSLQYVICLKFKYVGKDVEILFDHNFYDYDYNLKEEKINQITVKIDNAVSKEIRDKLFNERWKLRNDLQANIKQKIINMQMDRFYKKETDSNFTLVTKTTTEKLIQILNSFTGINQFDNNNE